jgi:hypothetical protein
VVLDLDLRNDPLGHPTNRVCSWSVSSLDVLIVPHGRWRLWSSSDHTGPDAGGASRLETCLLQSKQPPRSVEASVYLAWGDES